MILLKKLINYQQRNKKDKKKKEFKHIINFKQMPERHIFEDIKIRRFDDKYRYKYRYLFNKIYK